MALLNETESVLSYLDKEVSGSSSWLRVWGAGPRLKSWDVLLSSPGHLLLLAGLRPHTEDPASRQRRDPSGAPLPGRCSRDATRGSVQAAWCVCVCVGGVGVCVWGGGGVSVREGLVMFFSLSLRRFVLLNV